MRRATSLVVVAACGGGEVDVAPPEIARPAPTASAGPTAGVDCVLAHATSQRMGARCALVDCEPGFADCDAVAANGCEASLLTGPSTCGACDRTCATCERGACGGVVDLSNDAGAREMFGDGGRVAWLAGGRLRVHDGFTTTTWATGLSVSDDANEAGAIALGAGFAIVADLAGGSLLRVDAGGPAVLAAGRFASVTLRGDVAYALRLVGDAPAALVRVPLDGTAPSELAPVAVKHACRIAVDDARLWWTDPDTETVWRVALAGGEPEAWAMRQRMACGIVVDDTRAHWVSVDPTLAVFVVSVAKDDVPDPDWIQTAFQVGAYAPGAHAWDLALSSGAVWVANAHDGTLWRVDAAAGSTTLAAGAQTIRGVASAGQGVAWGTPAGVVRLTP